MRLAQGQFGWVDLSTTDVMAAKTFCAELFLPPLQMGPNRFAGAMDPTGAMSFFGSFRQPA